MAIINIITGPLEANRFSGGTLCILEYAHGLHQKGHRVNIIPSLPSPYPKWFKKPFGTLISNSKENENVIRIKGLSNLIKSLCLIPFKRKRNKTKKNIQDSIYRILLSKPSLLPHQIGRYLSLEYLNSLIPDSNITIATHFETALPTKLYGKGNLFYFAQHFEPLFKNEFPNPVFSELDALQSYQLGLRMIANSTWLQKKLSQETNNSTIELSPNAIDHSLFSGDPKPAMNKKTVNIISYGGRDAIWKGFREMAEAIRIARETCPNYTVHWNVYGSALLPPNNPIAPYHHLGFLNSDKLAEAYRQNDILLSASWYESFPLFPLEAMACGIPVITTSKGTEDYAFHGKTAHLVKDKEPNAIAQGLIKFIKDSNYRQEIAQGGNKISKLFNWEKSVNTFEKIILSNQNTPVEKVG